jgi:hypothetical protein
MMRGPRVTKVCRQCNRTFKALVSRPQHVFCTRECKKKAENEDSKRERRKAALLQLAIAEAAAEEMNERGVAVEIRMVGHRAYVVPVGTKDVYKHLGRQNPKDRMPKLNFKGKSKTASTDGAIVGVDLRQPTITAEDICRMLGIPMPAESNKDFKRRF